MSKTNEDDIFVIDFRVVEINGKVQKDLFLDYDTIEMYERMAVITKQVVNNLKYHLT